ncbi:hypothetical protein ABID16_004073 [Rhizobium aquaticum]|uniref:Uncharacterized protein n=1 Tax=Rhizobium aquaticum TaxID=1549636 RepID=A0ABV2J4Q7_9HYPH
MSRRKSNVKPSIFGMTNSRDFLNKLEGDFADWKKDPGSSRLALNCVLTAYHMHDWVWSDWLKEDASLQSKLALHDKNSFQKWLFRTCVWFHWVEELANGTKHFGRPKSFEALKVSALPFAFDKADAGFDSGSWDGPMPYMTGDNAVLLIDNGESAGELRWMPLGQLLDVVVRFWNDFFLLYAPAHLNEENFLVQASTLTENDVRLVMQASVETDKPYNLADIPELEEQQLTGTRS